MKKEDQIANSRKLMSSTSKKIIKTKRDVSSSWSSDTDTMSEGVKPSLKKPTNKV
jgi:hypothetical protein